MSSGERDRGWIWIFLDVSYIRRQSSTEWRHAAGAPDWLTDCHHENLNWQIWNLNDYNGFMGFRAGGMSQLFLLGVPQKSSLNKHSVPRPHIRHSLQSSSFTYTPFKVDQTKIHS